MTRCAPPEHAAPLALPACADAIVSYPSDGSSIRDHAGGQQASGAFAIVPFEHAGDDVGAGVRVASLANPLAPAWGPFVARARGQTTNAGAAALFGARLRQRRRRRRGLRLVARRAAGARRFGLAMGLEGERFDAGAGVYVQGNGGLLLYGVEHYNDGYPGTKRAVKVREFP
jgi:hypothetical protein